MKRLGPLSNQTDYIEGIVHLTGDPALAGGETMTNSWGAPQACGLEGGEFVICAEPDNAIATLPPGCLLSGRVVSIGGTNPLQTMVFISLTNCRAVAQNVPDCDIRYMVITKSGTVSPP